MKTLILIAAIFLSSCAALEKKTNPVDGQVTYTVRTNVVEVIENARAANAVTAPFNPYSPLIEIALGMTTAGLGWLAVKKTKDANKARELLRTVISVENADENIRKGVMDSIGPEVRELTK